MTYGAISNAYQIIDYIIIILNFSFNNYMYLINFLRYNRILIHFINQCSINMINTYPADHDYCFSSGLLVDQKSLLLGMKSMSKHKDL